MASFSLLRRLRKKWKRQDRDERRPSFLRRLVSGTFFRPSDLKQSSDLATIRSKIDMMRALAKDSQIATAISYYATDATQVNSAGQIIWATSEKEEIANVINDLFKRLKVNRYVRDHIVELTTIGNAYMPTTLMYKTLSKDRIANGVALDNNTIIDDKFDLVPAYMIPPEDIVHLWSEGQPQGYGYKPEEDESIEFVRFPEDAVIHFSLGGCLGKYSLSTRDPKTGDEVDWDIQFADPLLEAAVTPTQTLNLLEDALLLSSFVRVVKFINVDCREAEEEEIQNTLQQVKDAVEQQLSIDTNTGRAESYLNPQAPNNFIYVPKVDATDPISVTDLNMTEANDAENKMLDHFETKKLSVLGIPKEALNYSSNEGLGGAGSVMSQRSALYANSLQRIEQAYLDGWTEGLNAYFRNRNMSGFVDKFELHMQPIITLQSTVQFDKRDAALNQAIQYAQLLRDNGVTDPQTYQEGFVEILSETFPKIGTAAASWSVNIVTDGGGSDEY